MAAFGSAVLFFAVASAVSFEDEACAGGGTCGASVVVKDSMLMQTAAAAHGRKVASSLAKDVSDGVDMLSLPQVMPPKLPPPFPRVPRTVPMSAAPQTLHLEQQLSTFVPTSDELQSLELVKALRSQGFTCPADASEGYTTSTSYPPNNAPLLWDCRLFTAARKYAMRMASENFFCHDCQGSDPCSRTAAEGFPARLGCGENIAAGRQSPSDALEQWKASAGHCRNLMEPGYKQFGVGYAYGATSTYRYYWAQGWGSTIKGVDQSCIGGAVAPTPAPGCADTDTEQNCALYKAQNLCSTANVKTACRDTCNICNGPPSPQPTPQPGCQDTDNGCAHYAAQGYCTSSPNVQAVCQSTCGLCGSTPHPQPQPTQEPTPSTTQAAGCQDTDGSCIYYAAQGYCVDDDNVRTACQSTCGLCAPTPQPMPQPAQQPTPQPSPSCQDTDRNCAYYKAHGYCTTSPNVQAACRSKCGLC